MKFEFDILSFETNSADEILLMRGLNPGGRVQQVIDNAIIGFSDSYIPFDTGMLRDSGYTATVPGSGVIVWDTPYARRQYYENQGSGMRGRLWFERMKADHRDDILQLAADESGGEKN